MNLHPWLCYTRQRHCEPLAAAPAIAVEGLRASYPHAAGLALDVAQLRVQPGQMVALIGPNGSGKSTLLKTIAGLLAPDAGTVHVFGVPAGGCHHRTAYLAQRSEIAWRFPITVRGLVNTGRYVHLGWLRRLGAADHQLVASVMAQFQIAQLADRQIGELSGGQQQRALLARALVQGAELLLLDEPLTAVDAETRQIIAAVLEDLRQAGKTIVVATHEHGRIEETFDAVAHLQNGRLAHWHTGRTGCNVEHERALDGSKTDKAAGDGNGQAA